MKYEVVFSDSYILDSDAESSLAFASSYSSAKARATSINTADPSTTSGELSTLRHDSGDASSHNADDFILEKPETYEYMMLESAPYLCALPLAEASRNATEAQKSKDDEAKELARATDKGWELLKELEGNCMYFVSGWWSYSFCYNSEVKQFHALPPGRGGVPAYPPTEDETVPSFVLGQFNGRPKTSPPKQVDPPTPETSPKKSSVGKDTTDLAQIQIKGDMRYMVQKLSGGSTCDITGRPRKIEVQFHCHPQSADRIGWIKEVSTCAYLMVIYTPRLCNDVAFQPPKENEAQQIICKEIVSEADLEQWRAKKAAEAARKLVGSKGEAADSSRPIVGGIEVGGMKIVGSEGKRIDAPKVFHPAEAEGETVAKWSPMENEGKIVRMTNDQLRDLDLNPGIVDEMRTELHKLANNRAWKLEVVEGPGGIRELRGIVEDDEEEDIGEEPLQGQEETEAVVDGEKKESEEGKGEKQAGGMKRKKGEKREKEYVKEKDKEDENTKNEETGSEETFKDEL